MSYIVKPTEVKSLYPGDKDFKFMIDLVEYPRAAVTVTKECPANYRDIIYTCQAKGWIKPIAYVPTKELVWEELQR